MKVIIFILSVLILTSNVFSQNSYEYSNKYELKVGGELNQIVPSIGVGKNFYFSRYISIAPEIIMLGFPIASGTYRFNFRINKILRTSLQGGVGITFGAPLSMVGIIGANFSYKLSNNIYLFIEPRLYLFQNKIVSINNGIWGIDNLNKINPFVLSIGIGL
ncbi:MAG: hypothetical protein H6609_17175 [Ignavibacteriales bacterium]|nr:hypothetical protein [Ignavibacteriales bacterium]